MARRKNSQRKNKKPSYIFLRNAIAFLFVFFLLFLGGEKLTGAVKNSKYFKVKTIVYPQGITVVNETDLAQYYGRNIFTVDVERIRQDLRVRHPQLARLQVLKRLPDQIVIVAKQRNPVIQARLRGQNVILDAEAVILNPSGPADADLPYVVGLNVGRVSLSPGRSVKNSRINTAIVLVQAFTANQHLQGIRIKEMDMSHLSKIRLDLDNGLNVILDNDKPREKLNKLGLMLSQAVLNPEEVRYIDLRFQEPIVGTK